MYICFKLFKGILIRSKIYITIHFISGSAQPNLSFRFKHDGFYQFSCLECSISDISSSSSLAFPLLGKMVAKSFWFSLWDRGNPCMANSFNATSSSTPRLTCPCKYRIKSLIIRVVLLFYISHLSLFHLFLFLKFLISFDRQFILIHTVYGLILSCGSLLWQCCILICIISFYLIYSSCYGQSHQFVPICTIFLIFLICHRSGSSTMVTVSDSCLIHTMLPYYLFIIGLVHQQWSLSVIHA